MKNQLFLLGILFLLSGCCCQTFNGYGRYEMNVDCEKVVIDGTEYVLTLHTSNSGPELTIDNHSATRGIYRKTRPWLYIHGIDEQNNKIDITFDSGSKPEYPLYTGNSASIFDVYSQPYELKESTCALFQNNHWLVAHKFLENGVNFDLQQNLNSQTNESWSLITPNIFVSSDGSLTNINLINTAVKLSNFNFATKTATVEFIQI